MSYFKAPGCEHGKGIQLKYNIFTNQIVRVQNASFQKGIDILHGNKSWLIDNYDKSTEAEFLSAYNEVSKFILSNVGQPSSLKTT